MNTTSILASGRIGTRTLLLVLGLSIAPVAFGSTDGSPLHDAVRTGDLATLRSVVAAGENPNPRDNAGRTALSFAVETGNEQAVRMLLDAGASPDINDFLGRAPLHHAVGVTIGIARQLLAARADVDIRNSGGVTPLMQAAGAGRRDVVRLLLKAGARVDFRDYQGNTAEDWARRGQDAELATLLSVRIQSVQAPGALPAGDENFAEDVFTDVHFPLWFEPSFLDLREDLATATERGKTGLLVFLSTRRCSYCKAFIDKVLEIPDVRRRVQSAFDVVGLEIMDDSPMIDPEGNRSSVRDYATANEAAFTPTLIFYGAQGRRMLKIVGYYPAERFREVLDYLEGGHYDREPLRQYLARVEATPLPAPTPIIRDDELFERPPHMLDRTAFAAERPLVVVFESPGCEACQRLHERVLSDRSVRRLMTEFDSIQLDATDTVSRIRTPDGGLMSPAQWYEALGLSYSPAILFFDRDGQEAMRLDSETQRFRMEGTLQLVLEGGHKQDAQLQRWRWKKAVQVFDQSAQR